MRRSSKVRIWLLGPLLLAGGAAAQGTDLGRYFDIRLSDEKGAVIARQRLRAEKGATAAGLADARRRLAAARADLAARVPTLEIVPSVETGAPEVVGVRGFDRLSGPSDAPTEVVARRFIETNSWVYGLSPAQAVSLELDADYTNPAGNISWVRLRQRIHGLSVFRGEVTVALTSKREIFRTMGQLAAGLPARVTAPEPGLSAAEAVAAAADALGMKAAPSDLVLLEAAAGGAGGIFEREPFSRETKVELVYFPLGLGAIELAWSMVLWGEVDAYYMLVSAEDGLLLFMKNITEHQTQSATYEVYRNINAFIDLADSPAPLTPGPTDPNVGEQGALLTRELVTLIGNEGALSFNDNGWITDGANGTDGHTDGNNVEAGLDLANPDGVDAPVSGTGRIFSTAWNPPPGNPPPGQAPTVQAARDGAIIQLFYTTNRYHDALYELGFTEPARNFQKDNFGRGGLGGDWISAEGQDFSGTNNANFSTPADGERGRMQMFVFTGSDPDRDGTTDSDIIIHELTHGLSNRLHGNASGLGNNMSRSMGEGWSDFYAHALLSEPTDPIDGIYTTGAYALLDTFGLGTTNTYYGIRRFPKAVISSTGGPGNRPHNPLTFADLNAGCSLGDGAFPPSPGTQISNSCDQLHAAGEIWSSALWEVRALMIERLGFAAGNQRVLQLVTDGMKLSPIHPTFLQGRDAIIAAAAALPGSFAADVADVREGFRRRGMGHGAEVVSISPAQVIESFDHFNANFAPPLTWESLSCADAARNPIPGETVVVSVPVENTTDSTVGNVVMTLDGGHSVAYGDIESGVTVTKQILYTIPPGTACGSELVLDIEVVSDLGVQMPAAAKVPVGQTPSTVTFFSNATPIDLPGGQPATTTGPSSPYPSPITVSGIDGPVFAATVTLTLLTHTWPDDIDVLVEAPGGESLIVLSDALGATDVISGTVTLFDGAAAPAPDSGPLASGTYKPTNYGGGDSFDTPAPAGGYADPAIGATFADVFGALNANGTWNLWIQDDAAGDSGSMGGGWSLGIVSGMPSDCVACATAFCQPTLDVSDQRINATLDVDACEALTSSDLEILGPNGDVTFKAGRSISLGAGVVVGADARFTEVIDPSLLP
jgi:hypothetical protein